ncbi:MAG TPA: hypothetical protein VMT38_07345 [Terracidiphilus sp.]|nr:hypothetical protein [Terracidiphilus sp.]
MYNLALFLQDQPDLTQAHHALMMMVPIFMLFGVIFLAIIIIPFWFICKKAGFSPWLSLLNVIPLGNLILVYVLAFAQWKVMPIPQAAYPVPYPPPPQPPYPPQA